MSLYETFDIFDDRMQKVGTASRQEAHLLGLWHQTFHCWVYRNGAENSLDLLREEPCLLFQLRDSEKDTFPNLLDISCAGHLLSGESPEDGIRELKEELGLDTSFDELYSCGVFIEENIISKTLIDREFCHVFLYECHNDVSEYTFQESELSGLYFINMNQFKQLMEGDLESLVAEGITLNKSTGERFKENRQVSLSDFVPHPQAYYELIFRECKSLSEQK